VERLFKTFQDRLIKEMRLAGVSTLDEANRFLEDYLPISTSASRSSRPRPPIGIDPVPCTGSWTASRAVLISSLNSA
jgi:hypothetical protein